MATRRNPKITHLQSNEPILEANQKIRHQVMQRAYELSSASGPIEKQTSDWLRAEAELVIRPTMELLQTKTGWRVELALPGVLAGEIDIRVGNERLAVEAKRVVKRTGEQLVVSEYKTDHIFREVSIPSEVDRTKTRATLRDGILAIDLLRTKPTPVRKVAKTTSEKPTTKRKAKKS
ncbi:MAG: Hsp20/alpha crystallin family protein [Planctomycetota bacterium]